MKLTPTQQLASTATGKNILVSAGAGTGKTRVLVERFLNFITTGNALVTEILALTYTEKAANEMKERIQTELRERGMESARRDLESAYISTIHAFCARVLREHPLEAGVDPDFRVMESEESDYMKELALDEVFELNATRGGEYFEFVKTYGESALRSGLLKVLNAASGEGKTLDEFFEGASDSSLVTSKNTQASLATSHQSLASAQTPRVTSHQSRVTDLLSQLNEPTLAEEFGRFVALGDRLPAQEGKVPVPETQWTWQLVEDFKDWFKNFARKGNKETKPTWKALKAACEKFLSAKIEVLGEPARAQFEAFALLFEAAYEKAKRERGFLDFDDLQIYTVRLFRGNNGTVSDRIRKRYQKKFRQIMVDEFQDTNPLQLELINLLAGSGNLFFVGDYKQSIYSFRGAEPKLFLEKETEYDASDEGVRIPLLENFRSEAGVLDFVNEFFKETWRDSQINFEELICRATNTTGEASLAPTLGSTELILVNAEATETTEQLRMREADLMAERILELKEAGESFGEMAILFQAMNDIALYEQALKKRGIPYYVLSGGGFYHQPEVRDMMSYLAFLENPHADIALAASLRSPLFQVTDNTLFWLARKAKLENRETPLYLGVKQFQEIEELPEEEIEKLDFFNSLTHELLNVKDHLKLTELLDLILSRTSYELTVLADPQGVRRYANLKKLVNLGRELERYEALKLGAFLRTVRRLETQEVRESEAAIEAEESGEVVRILTIHRSKGLEFENVFLADCSRQKKSDQTSWIKVEAGKGYGIEILNPLILAWEQPLRWQAIDESLKARTREEWKRLFYVATTRAKKRLVLSGSYKEKKFKKGVGEFLDGNSWLDWMMDFIATEANEERGLVKILEPKDPKHKRMRRALAEKKDLREVFGNFEPVSEADLAKSLVPGTTGKGSNAKKTNLSQSVPGTVKSLIQSLAFETEELFRATADLDIAPSRVIDLPVSAYAAYDKSKDDYAATYLGGTPAAVGSGDRLPAKEGKVPVPEMPAEDLDANAFPESEEDVHAADFGTAVHSVLEHLNLRDPEPTIVQRVIDHLGSYPVAKQREAIDILFEFIKTKRFEWIQNAKKVYREVPFILNERHGRIQGVIDLLVCDEVGDWHVLDYKTAVGDEKKLEKSGYLMQIKIYALAVQEILGITPKSGIVYFLKNNFETVVDLDEKKLTKFAGKLEQVQEDILEISTS